MMFSTYVVWYLFLAGAGAGCYVIMSGLTIAQLRGASAIPPCWPGFRFGSMATPVLLVFASLFLFADLGAPEKVWAVFLHPFQSAISAGACLVVCLIVLSAVVSLNGILGCFLSRCQMILCCIGGSLLAFGVMAYTGILFSSMVSVDFWATPLLTVLFILSSLTTGLGVLICLEVLIDGKSSGLYPFYHSAAIVGGLLEAIALAAFLFDRYCFSEVSRLSCDMLFTGDLAFPFWLGLVCMGFLLPAFLQILYAKVPVLGLMWVSSLGVLVAGFSLRYCIVNASLLPTVLIGGFL